MMRQHNEEMFELVSVYALGALDAAGAECREMREHISQCPICRKEFYVARAAAAAIGMSAAESPPPELRSRILSNLPPRTAGVRLLRPHSRTRWYSGLAVAAAIVILAVLWWTLRPQPQTWAARCVPTARHCHAHGVLSAPANDLMRLQLRGLAALPPGKSYQAWVIVAGAPPRPEPTFKTDSRGNGSVDIPVSASKGVIVAVTVEPESGSQKPTTAPFLTATIE